MKKLFLTLFFAVLATAGMYAQQISVVSSGGTTTLYQTLQDAVDGADPGSVIYLPGGGFGKNDTVTVTKKLTIIGIGHYAKKGNVDGATIISGSLSFKEGSSGSAVMGCYITGDVGIYANVNDVLIRYCNVQNVRVYDPSCLETTVNQCYLRNGAHFHGANGYFTNNVSKDVWNLCNGYIENNLFTTNKRVFGEDRFETKWSNSSIIRGNIIITTTTYGYNEGPDAIVSGNMCPSTDWNIDTDLITVNADWNDVFENYNGGAVSPASNFHFKEAYAQYENQVGIYSGTGFKDEQLAPVPYIVAKRVDTETDASGKLNVKIRVKAGQ